MVETGPSSRFLSKLFSRGTQQLATLLLFCSLAAFLGCGGGNSGNNNSNNSNNGSGTAPAFSSASSTAFTVGVAGTFTVTATGSPAATLSESGTLPSGVGFNASTGVLSGTPAAGTANTYSITFTATNSAGSVTQNFTLTVDAALSISGFTASNSLITDGTSTSLLAVFSGGTGSVNNGVGTVTSGTAVTVSPTTTTTYTLTVTNSAGASVTQTVTVNVIAASNTGACASAPSGDEALLSGKYVFLLKGFDNGQGTRETQAEPAMVGGILNFNGTDNNGLILSGGLDQNLNSTGGTLSLPTTGTYVVANQMACLTLNTSQGTQHYEISLANINGTTQIAATGHMVNIDATGPFTQGILRQQTGVPTSLAGSFAFGLDLPQNSTQGGGKSAVAGVITFLAGGTASGEFDQSNSGQIDGQNLPATWPTSGAPGSLTNGSYSLAASGRGTLTVTATGATSPSTSIIYAVSASDLLIMNNQDQTKFTVVGGEAIAQSGTFGAGSLSGTFVSYASGLNATVTPYTSNTQIGVITANGSGMITAANLWADSSGTITNSSGLTGTSYAVDATGRVLNNSGSGPLYYLVSTNYGFILQPNAATGTGMIEPQTPTSAPSGTFAFGNIDEQEPNNGVSAGIATLTATTLSAVSDSGGAGNYNINQTFGPVNISVDGTTGLGSVSSNTSACTIGSGNPCQLIFYVISGNRFVLMDATPSQSDPTLTIGDQ